MRNFVLITAVAWVALTSIASAQPNPRSRGAVTITDGFVCPVIRTDSVLNSPHGHEIAGGHYTIFGPDHLRVPEHATNQDGAGDPMGEHAAPGDDGYSPIWNIC